MQGPIGAGLLQKLKPTGVYGLAYWDNGFKDMTANRPLHKPEDFRGLKMRIQSLEGSGGADARAGRSAPGHGLLRGSSRRSDGRRRRTEHPRTSSTQRVHEVQKHMTVSQHGYIWLAVIVNLKSRDKSTSRGL